MKTTTITVSAGRCFNHPYESYSNLQPHVEMTATIEEGDDPIECAKQLQHAAETLVEDHKRTMLASIEELEQMRRSQKELQELGSMMATQQRRIDELRKAHPELQLPGGSASSLDRLDSDLATEAARETSFHQSEGGDA